MQMSMSRNCSECCILCRSWQRHVFWSTK